MRGRGRCGLGGSSGERGGKPGGAARAAAGPEPLREARPGGGCGSPGWRVPCSDPRTRGRVRPPAGPRCPRRSGFSEAAAEGASCRSGGALCRSPGMLALPCAAPRRCSPCGALKSTFEAITQSCAVRIAASGASCSLPPSLARGSVSGSVFPSRERRGGCGAAPECQRAGGCQLPAPWGPGRNLRKTAANLIFRAGSHGSINPRTPVPR